MRAGDAKVEGRNAFLPSFLLFVATLLLLAPFWSYVTDDTYIHLRYAENLARGRGFSFWPGEPSYGFSSPLWIALLALADRLGADPLVTAKILGGTSAGLSAVLVRALAAEWIAEPRLAWCATLAWLVDAWMLRWALSGMETPLGVLLVVGGFLLATRARRMRGSPLPSMALFSLAALVRPECLLLVLLAWFDVLVFSPRRRRDVLHATVPVAILLLPWGAYAAVTFGQVLPNTLHAKAPALAAPAAVGAKLFLAAKLLAATRGIELALLAAGSGALALRLLRGQRRDVPRENARTFSLPLAWVLLLPLAAALRDAVLVSRYLLVVAPILAVMAWACLPLLLPEPAARIAWTRRLRAAAVLCLLASGLNLGILFGLVVPHARAFSHGLHASLGEIAAWLRENSAPDATVGTPDIGLLGYASERRIVDFSGLVTPELLPLQRGMKIEVFIAEMRFASRVRPDYIVDRVTEGARLPAVGPHGERLEIVLSRTLGPLGLSRRGDYVYTLYRVDWSQVPARGAVGPGGSEPGAP